MSETPGKFIGLTADIVSAFVVKNALPTAELPKLIQMVHAALHGLANVKPAEPEKPMPAVPIKKSVTPQHVISLEDGKPYKSLKRHLAAIGLTPAEYRAKWGLPSDYPMVAPDYSKRRSELARQMGLGRKAAAPALAQEPAPEPQPDTAPAKAPKRRGRAAPPQL